MDGDKYGKHYGNYHSGHNAPPSDEFANQYAWIEIENFKRAQRGERPMNTGERDAKAMELMTERLAKIPDSEFSYSKIADGIYPRWYEEYEDHPAAEDDSKYPDNWY